MQICVVNMDVLLLFSTSSTYNPSSFLLLVGLNFYTTVKPHTTRSFLCTFCKIRFDETELSHVAGERMMVTLAEFVFPFLSNLRNKIATIQNCAFDHYYTEIITGDKESAFAFWIHIHNKILAQFIKEIHSAISSLYSRS